MDDYYVGPDLLKSQLGPLNSLDKKIKLYDRRVKGWFINIAIALKRDPSDLGGGPGADFVSLMIAMSLFEAHGVLLQGEKAPLKNRKDKKTGKVMKEPNSQSNFEYGFSRFLSVKHPGWSTQRQSEMARLIYTQVRCGLYHAGMVKKGIRLYRGPDEEHPTPAIKPRYYNSRLVRVTFNVPAFVIEVQDYFGEYLVHLMHKGNPLRRSFAEGWDIVSQQLKRTP